MTAPLVSGLLGALLTPFLVHRGLGQLTRSRPFPRWGWFLCSTTGFGAGAAAVGLSAARVPLALLPALTVWSLTLTAIAWCDSTAHRIPTRLIRQATTAVLVLLTLGTVVAGSWETWGAGLGGALFLAGAFAAAWRYAGAGRGDVRLAALGGFGLGFPSAVGLVAGLLAWTAVTAVQSVRLLAQGGSLRTEIALAPGLAIGLLVAALPSW
jgi:leader peptidase (prepilin peptidase)/N-methyltransferase